MRRKDPVTPELRLAVLARDGGCVAPRLGGSFMDCGGRLQLEHVKSEHRMGLRAPSDMAHLVTLCDQHTEPGMRAGRSWNLNAQNRERMREYLAAVTTRTGAPHRGEPATATSPRRSGWS